MAGLFDTPTTPTLRRLLEEVKAGSILVPRFQRPFVWKDQQRLDLLDSVARGLPIGALMVWRTREYRLECYDKLGPFSLPLPDENGPWTYLIDGHQRLTTLFAAFTPLADGVEVDDDVTWPILVDLREDPPQIVLPGRGRRPPFVVPVSALSSNARVYQAQRALWAEGADAEADRLEELASGFRDYVVPLIPLVSEDIRVVTHAFARVNRGGTSMSEAHLAAALAYQRIPLREELQRAVEEFGELGWPLEEKDFLNALKLYFGMDVYRAPTTELLDALGAESGDAASLRRAMEELLDGLLTASVALQVAGVEGRGALPYTYQLLLLAVAARRQPDASFRGQVAARAVQWFWHTTFTEAFTGATGTTFQRALEALAAWLWDSEPLQEAGVIVQERHSKWGAVRTVGRMLAMARATGDRTLARWLGLLGSQAVHKLRPDLDRDRPGSWVIADATLLAEARDALSRASPPPDRIALQLDPGAWDALLAGDTERFLAIQDARSHRIEAEAIRACGLIPETPA